MLYSINSEEPCTFTSEERSQLQNTEKKSYNWVPPNASDRNAIKIKTILDSRCYTVALDLYGIIK